MGTRSASIERWNDRWMGTLIAAMFVAVTIFGAPTLWRAHNNEGVPGTFTALDEECSGRSGCSWTGTFVRDDGERFADVSYDGPEIDERGDKVPAQAIEKDPSEVYPPSDRTILWMIPVAVACAIYLGFIVRRTVRQCSSA
jgi:hypothetical protein